MKDNLQALIEAFPRTEIDPSELIGRTVEVVPYKDCWNVDRDLIGKRGKIIEPVQHGQLYATLGCDLAFRVVLIPEYPQESNCLFSALDIKVVD